MICNAITRTQPRLLSRSQDSQFEHRDISSPDIRATQRGVIIPAFGQATTRSDQVAGIACSRDFCSNQSTTPYLEGLKPLMQAPLMQDPKQKVALSSIAASAG